MINLLFLFSLTAARFDPLNIILQSPRATLKAYRDFKTDQNVEYKSPTEDRMRLGEWKKSARLVATQNSQDRSTAKLALNFFAVLTPEERKQYLGVNVTGHAKNRQQGLTLKSGMGAVPDAVDWTQKGIVTPVKNQAACGSCWTFGAVGGLETRYALTNGGVLRNFAEQEFLDCVYGYDGCEGGWMHDCYSYSADNGGRLAATVDYPYTMVSARCASHVTEDSMIAAKMRGYVAVGNSEEAHVAAIAEGPITIAFEVTDVFHFYSTGILKDLTCSGEANHAVTALGYTPKYFLVKNSWGDSWGESGFVRFARNHHNCDFYAYSSYPHLEETGIADTNPAHKHTDFVVPSNDDWYVPVVCSDKYVKCEATHCTNARWAEKYCARTCNKCKNGEGCPLGTVKCSDGVCRHEHMC